MSGSGKHEARDDFEYNIFVDIHFPTLKLWFLFNGFMQHKLVKRDLK